ncbi:MAG TPA: hypothetical protein VKD22_16820 [Ramlibacter sp.]|nr:hypothetical protein [Ramlibacter sp.]
MSAIAQDLTPARFDRVTAGDVRLRERKVAFDVAESPLVVSPVPADPAPR